MFITTTTINIPKILEDILTDLKSIGILPILVGGCVRDHLLNISSKDFDIELYNTSSLSSVEKCLKNYGNVKEVGKSFGVLLLSTPQYSFDFALARKENKIEDGHKGFKVITSSSLTYDEAALRRDFTINSIGYNFFEKKFLDPYRGIADLKNKIIKHIKDETFVEDPLRVYRAIQFASRFDFEIDPNTKKLCKNMVKTEEFITLPKERVFEELKKLFLKSSKPSKGMSILKEFRILKYFPELEVLVGCIQDEEYHPEGDVWVHTLMTLDEMVKLKTGDEYRDLYLFYALLCHDLGKPFCTKEIDGKITSHKHEALGVEPTQTFLNRITNEKRFIEKVIPLVKNHLAPFQLYKAESSTKAVKRLSLRCNIEDLCIVCLADCKGRTIPDKKKCDDAISWVLEKAREMNISEEGLKPLIQGRDLINLGLKPSKEFKDILDFALNLQIDYNLDKENILEKIKEEYIK